MGSETMNSSSPSSKRTRDPEDEVYVDNLHCHKRYLSEMMASSLNGLTVGDPIPETIMDSPARSESMFYLRDEMMPYSPMSEDLDDVRCYETSMNACSSQLESLPTSPISPHRCKPLNSSLCSSPPSTSQPSSGGGTVLPIPSQQPRQWGSDTEGRFPSSPSDICHSADLRRAALLRSVQMRAQPPGPSAFELPFAACQATMQNISQAEVGHPCSYMKSLVDDEREYQIDASEAEFEQEDKGEESGDEET
ncbi:hypothetical protein Nepgr_025390 [Nepenthes gracilis]|uniref:Uncharacterized protein n=1 Tax=Nepenthes gracilis TaxID=150966 RepID=A0AAD3XZG6_NEPGR|nr:hypothetical protein Nepgr_025390 [Nepenthes gracilis]